MQKLVTIYLDREGYRSGRRGSSESHGVVQEHLGDFIAAGGKLNQPLLEVAVGFLAAVDLVLEELLHLDVVGL